MRRSVLTRPTAGTPVERSLGFRSVVAVVAVAAAAIAVIAASGTTN